MARDYSVEVNGVTYKGTTASAQEQWEALHICMRTQLISVLSEKDMYEMTYVATMGAMDLKDVERLEKLVVRGKVAREDDNVEAALNLFRDEVHYYYLLIGYALRENLKGFWQLRGPKKRPTPEPDKTA